MLPGAVSPGAAVARRSSPRQIGDIKRERDDDRESERLLMGIMRLLGHRDQRMTLRYTRIADETVGREYFEALSRISERYQLQATPSAPTGEVDPDELLRNAICWVEKHLCAPE